MKFHDFAAYLHKLETTSSRLATTQILVELFKDLGVDARPAMYLLQGRLVPLFIALEFNLSQKSVLKVLTRINDKANQLFADTGDVGLVAEKLLQGASTSAVTISEVHGQLQKIAETTGQGSQEAKQTALFDLLHKVDALSAKYIVRVVMGELRLGVSEKTILDAFSWFLVGDKSMRTEIERAFGARADIGVLAEAILEAASADAARAHLADITVAPGTPIASKLVEREKDSAAVFKRLGECIVQPKLDGMRAQFHYDAKQNLAAAFSRNMESLTDMFPDMLAAVRALGVESIIIDSEVVGYDYENKTYLPFQETMQRRRKHDIDATAAAIPVRAMAFDILHLNGKDLTQVPLEHRLETLQALLKVAKADKIVLLDSPRITTAEQLHEYFTENVAQGLEGVIAKKLGTTYDPGTRNFDWIKLKANTRSDLVDTLDVVVIGYYIGQGDRAKYGFGSLLTAVYDADSDSYHSVAKVGSGFTDALAPTVRADLEKLRVLEQPENVVVQKSLTPDYWVTPQIVMEVTADEITRSPAHTAAKDVAAEFETDTKGRGLSLRFPRLKVWKRDKTAQQATSVTELVRLYTLRKQPKR